MQERSFRKRINRCDSFISTLCIFDRKIARLHDSCKPLPITEQNETSLRPEESKLPVRKEHGEPAATR